MYKGKKIFKVCFEKSSTLRRKANGSKTSIASPYPNTIRRSSSKDSYSKVISCQGLMSCMGGIIKVPGRCSSRIFAKVAVTFTRIWIALRWVFCSLHHYFLLRVCSLVAVRSDQIIYSIKKFCILRTTSSSTSSERKVSCGYSRL